MNFNEVLPRDVGHVRSCSVCVFLVSCLKIASLNAEHFYSRIANKLRLFAINAIQYEEFETEFDSGISYAYKIRDELEL